MLRNTWVFSFSAVSNRQLTAPFPQVLDKEFRAQFGNVFRHYNTVARQPFFAAVTGVKEPVFLEKNVPCTPPAKEAKAPKAEKAASAPKEPAAPKADKKKKDADEDEDDNDVPAEPKAKHPIELLGPAKSFPRAFSPPRWPPCHVIAYSGSLRSG